MSVDRSLPEHNWDNKKTGNPAAAAHSAGWSPCGTKL